MQRIWWLVASTTIVIGCCYRYTGGRFCKLSHLFQQQQFIGDGKWKNNHYVSNNTLNFPHDTRNDKERNDTES